MNALLLLAAWTVVQEGTPPPSSPPPPPPPTEAEALAALRKADDILSLRLRIDIKRGSFSDKDLAEMVPLLAALPDLRELDLAQTAVTEAGLAPLKRLKQLRVLVVSGKLLRSKAVAELQEANAKLIVSPSGGLPTGNREPAAIKPAGVGTPPPPP